MLVRYRQPRFVSPRVNAEFDRLVANTFGEAATGFTPAADVVTEGDDVVITLAVPGVAADDIEVTLKGRQLTVSGKRAELTTAENDKVLSRGLRRGGFTKSYRVPQGTEAAQISAGLNNGLLSVRVTQAIKPEPQEHRIAVVPQAIEAEVTVSSDE